MDLRYNLPSFIIFLNLVDATSTHQSSTESISLMCDKKDFIGLPYIPNAVANWEKFSKNAEMVVSIPEGTTNN